MEEAIRTSSPFDLTGKSVIVTGAAKGIQHRAGLAYANKGRV